MPEVKVVQGGKGTIDWGNGYSDSFDSITNDACRALGIQYENLNAEGKHYIQVDEDEVARFEIWGNRLTHA